MQNELEDWQHTGAQQNGKYYMIRSDGHPQQPTYFLELAASVELGPAAKLIA